MPMDKGTMLRDWGLRIQDLRDEMADHDPSEMENAIDALAEALNEVNDIIDVLND